MKIERVAVHAIAQTGRRRAVGEDMAEMSITLRAGDLGAAHREARIIMLGDGVAACRRIEAWPAGAAVIFCCR